MKFVAVQLWEPTPAPTGKWRRAIYINLFLFMLEFFAIAVHECEDEPEPAPATRMVYH